MTLITISMNLFSSFFFFFISHTCTSSALILIIVTYQFVSKNLALFFHFLYLWKRGWTRKILDCTFYNFVGIYAESTRNSCWICVTDEGTLPRRTASPAKRLPSISDVEGVEEESAEGPSTSKPEENGKIKKFQHTFY